MRRRTPAPISDAVRALAERLAPDTPLAALQRSWPDVAGPVVAAQARPVAERDGVVTLACSAAVWASELELMGPELAERLRVAAGVVVRSVRCRIDAPAAGRP